MLYALYMLASHILVSYLQACLVHTTETIRVRYFMDRLLEHRRPVMLVGNAGTGKSVLVGDKLGSLDAEKYMIKNVPFNYYTTSAMLQGRLYSRSWGIFSDLLSGVLQLYMYSVEFHSHLFLLSTK